ncbi:MAG: hypothetical protein ACYCZI_11800, partial [Metallibacterium scheffleri]
AGDFQCPFWSCSLKPGAICPIWGAVSAVAAYVGNRHNANSRMRRRRMIDPSQRGHTCQPRCLGLA